MKSVLNDRYCVVETIRRGAWNACIIDRNGFVGRYLVCAVHPNGFNTSFCTQYADGSFSCDTQLPRDGRRAVKAAYKRIEELDR